MRLVAMLSSLRGTPPTRWWPAVMLALVTAAGCGGPKLYKVEGKVVFPGGTPLSGGMVVFGPKDPSTVLGPRGEIQEDGTFRVSTLKEGDGAPEGEYRVLITPAEKGDPAPPPPFDRRFTSFEKSGLEYTVKPGKNEFFTITVEKRPGKRGPS